MSAKSRWCVLLSAVVVGALAFAPTARAQGLGRRYELAELKQMVSEAKVLVRAKATEAPLSRGGAADGYVWETSFEVVEVLKGEYGETKFTLELKSVLSDLNTSRTAMVGKEFVLPLVASGGAGRFRLVGDAGFASDTDEARKLVELAGGKVEATTGPGTGTSEVRPAGVPAAVSSPLRLRLEAVKPPYEVGKPALMRVTIENTSADLVAYAQAPFEVREGRLYLPGGGALVVTDSHRGLAVSTKENVHLKTDPPPPATPVSLIGAGRYEKEIDLAEFFDLSQPGVYLITMSVATPDGKEVILSNTAGLQMVGSLTPAVKTPVASPQNPEDSMVIPAPEAYRPGEITNGLAGWLRPSKAQFEVGEPILLELRLTNMGDRAFSIDTRLERMLALEVRPEGSSPAARERSQYFEWPAVKDEEKAYAYARLRPRAFWGKDVNINSLFGLSRAKMDESAAAVRKGAIEPSYETSGLTLFAFEKPGVYRIQATYEMAPGGSDGPKLWAGKLQTNPVFIRVVAGPGKDVPPAVTPGEVEP